MDWNKTKTIFIVVFGVLNVFLWSLYINQNEQVRNVEVLGQPSVEESLRLDNITYDRLPDDDVHSSYMSADIATFTKEEIDKKRKQDYTIIDGTMIRSTLATPYALKDKKERVGYKEFLDQYVVNGEQYHLWDVDEQKNTVLFFQQIVKEPIYYSPDATLTVYLNEAGEIERYEQKMLEGFVSFNQKKNLLTPFEAISTLATKGYLKQNTHVETVRLGYSTLVQFTETQVFAPTWHVKVRQKKDGHIQHFFVNAIEGKVVELQEERKDG